MSLAGAKWSSDLTFDSPHIKPTAGVEAGSGPFQNVLDADSGRAWAHSYSKESQTQKRALSNTG